MTAWRARLRWLGTPRGILVIAWLGFLLVNFPGFLPVEAADDLVNSRNQLYTDWNWPLLAAIWHWVSWVMAGPPGLLFVQSLLWLGGSHALLRRVLAPRAAAFAAAGVLWFPPILTTTGVISADVLLAALLVAGAAAIVSPRRIAQGVGLALLALASGLCEGALLAVLPICALGLAWRPDAAGWRRLALGLAAWLAVAAAGDGLRRSVAEPSGRREVALAVTDISGMMRYAKRIDAAALARMFDGVPLHLDQLPANHRRWAAHPDQMLGDRGLFEPATTYDEAMAIADGRDRMARAFPAAYLRYRFRVLMHLLTLKSIKPPTQVYRDFAENLQMMANLQFGATKSPIQDVADAVLYPLGKTFVFRPYVYFALALVALLLGWIRRDRLAVMLATSGLAYELALMFVTRAPAYRLSHWLTAATVLALAITCVPWIRARRRWAR